MPAEIFPAFNLLGHPYSFTGPFLNPPYIIRQFKCEIRRQLEIVAVREPQKN